MSCSFYHPRMEDVQIDNQPQNLKKYQMYFKRWVIILTLGVCNLNVQNFFECLEDVQIDNQPQNL